MVLTGSAINHTIKIDFITQLRSVLLAKIACWELASHERAIPEVLHLAFSPGRVPPADAMLKPGALAPPLALPVVGGGLWSLEDSRSSSLTLIAFYRGRFCPYCKGFVDQLASKLPLFQRRNIFVLAVSMDNEQQARQTTEEWSIASLPVGYGLSVDTARAWNVFLTTRQQDGCMATFCEPAIFLISPNKTIYAMTVQSIPCGRPDLDNLLDGLDFLAEQGYPVRGSA